ncbi:MAG: hypothetical protein QW275_01640 [Candidatus Anstonellaceae archaeon]
MPLINQFAQSSFAFEAAILAATISILIGGILFGVGLAFGLRKVRLTGQEEIAQGIISAAMAGVIISFVAILDSISFQISTQSPLPPCPSINNPSANAYSFYLCNLEAASSSYLRLASSLSRASDIVGFAASLKISAGAVQAQPFFALEEASRQISYLSQHAYWLQALAFMEFQLAQSIRAGSLAVFLPAGLFLRTFFATRKIGAAAMAIAVSMYVFFPLLFIYTFASSKALEESSKASEAAEQFNYKFASIPLLDLEQTSAVRDKMQEMSEGDFSSHLPPILSLSSRAISLGYPDLIIYPIVSLAISLVAASQLYTIFSMPIFSRTADLI